MDLSIYDGWVIYTHVGEIPFNKQHHIEQKLKTAFSYEGWQYQENHIYNVKIDTSVKVEFKEETTEQEREMGLAKYGLTLSSVFIDTWRNRKQHKNYCKDVLHKISWKKKAFYLIDGKMIPLSRQRC
jgi:hypothetical protein